MSNLAYDRLAVEICSQTGWSLPQQTVDKIAQSFALITFGYILVNVGVALVGLSVGSEFHRGKPSVAKSEASETSRNYTVHFTVSSDLSRDIHLVAKPGK